MADTALYVTMLTAPMHMAFGRTCYTNHGGRGSPTLPCLQQMLMKRVSLDRDTPKALFSWQERGYANLQEIGRESILGNHPYR